MTRFYLNGVYLHSAEGALTAAATDGYRLARRRAATSCDALGRSLDDRAGRELSKPIHRLLGKATGNVTLRRWRAVRDRGRRV